MARLTRAGWQKALACPGMWPGASPAIDACANGTSFATDQWGFLRPVGAFPDLGAVEGVYTPAGPGALTAVTKSGGGALQFGFTNYGGMAYTVQAGTNVAALLNTWSNLGPALEAPPGSGQFHFSDPQATNHPQRFYRVIGP